MFQDAHNLQDNALIQADVCIAGAGAAGITIARELRGSGLSVVLLEGGGLDAEESSLALYEGQTSGVGDVGLTGCRARQLGGTTSLWAGWCRPLDPDMFEVRDWMPGSGWPFDQERLVPFYKRAHRTVQIGAFEFDSAAIADRLGKSLLPLDPALASSVIYQYSPPTRFGSVYRADIDAANDIDAFFHANLVNIALNQDGTRVAAFEGKTLQGIRFSVQADRYILALGGIENARMMLASNTQQTAGIGNASDQLGRNFMEHPHFYRGATILLPRPPDMDLYLRRQPVSTTDDLDPEPRDARIVAALGITPEVRRQQQLMGFAATLREASFEESQAATGPLASAVIGQLIEHDADAYGLYVLDIRAEQRPTSQGRITLLDERDALGVPKLSLNWHITAEDLDSVKRTLERIGAALGKAGAGRLWMPLDADGQYAPTRYAGGCHHIGTTRMSDSPNDGVVDANLKVHGLDNMYVAGSSVFPTGGFANPTLTIVALAHRLADHLKERP